MRVASPKFSACDLREHSQRILRLKAVDRKVRREPNRARREFYKTTKCSCRNIVENLASIHFGQHKISGALDVLVHFSPQHRRMFGVSPFYRTLDVVVTSHLLQIWFPPSRLLAGFSHERLGSELGLSKRTAVGWSVPGPVARRRSAEPGVRPARPGQLRSEGWLRSAQRREA